METSFIISLTMIHFVIDQKEVAVRGSSKEKPYQKLVLEFLKLRRWFRRLNLIPKMLIIENMHTIFQNWKLNLTCF